MFITHGAQNKLVQDYFFASAVEEALAYLAAHRGLARIIAGGTDLMPQVQNHQAVASHLVDVSRVCTMRRIRQENGHLTIGGSVTFANLLENEAVQRVAPLIHQAARCMGTPEIRCLATLAGNIVSAWGNSGGAVALVALDAEAEIINLTGTQWLPVASLFVRQGVSRVDSSAEIVTGLRLPALTPGEGGALEQITLLDGSCRSPLMVALRFFLSPQDEVIERCSVAMGSTLHVPKHLPMVEQAMEGGAVRDPRTRAALTDLLTEHVSEASKQAGVKPSFSRQEFVATVARSFERVTAMALASLQPVVASGAIL